MRRRLTAESLSTGSEPAGRRPFIELTGVLQEHGQLYVVFKAGASERILQVDAHDLETFAAFQRRVASELGLQIRHQCQCERGAARAGAWSAAVERARARGS